jgi:hypothetical protein
MSVFMDDLFDELAMPEVNFELQEISEELKEALAEQQADQLYFDNQYNEGTYSYDDY